MSVGTARREALSAVLRVGLSGGDLADVLTAAAVLREVERERARVEGDLVTASREALRVDRRPTPAAQRAKGARVRGGRP
ncbi:MAG: hypothetical protein LAO51_04500 [Acidobacteriia bacterium]|nr:hypothetical protein [Terriglobia bacterium]